jgi:hypothetical protein
MKTWQWLTIDGMLILSSALWNWGLRLIARSLDELLMEEKK